jgi:hypothetical protein
MTDSFDAAAMMKTTLSLILSSACAIASAQDVLLAGHVRRVVLQPAGTENCPPACPAIATKHPDGTTTV